MRANVEDRGIKGDCTPLMEAASGGYVDIVRLLIAHGADVNAQSSAGKIILNLELSPQELVSQMKCWGTQCWLLQFREIPVHNSC